MGKDPVSESRALSLYSQDGIWDIYAGLLLAGLGINMVTNSTLWLIVLMALAVIAVSVRKYIVSPRLSQITFTAAEQARARKSKTIGVIILVVLLALGAGYVVLSQRGNLPQSVDTWLKSNSLLAFGGLIALILAIVAFITAAKRFYLYAVLTFAVFAYGQSSSTPDKVGFGTAIALAGGVIIAWGLILLFRFLRKYPKPKEEE